jgi:hypothetical protein
VSPSKYLCVGWQADADAFPLNGSVGGWFVCRIWIDEMSGS